MATNFPTSLDTSAELPAEGASTPLSTNHVTAHQNIQDALEAVEAKIGVDSSAVTSSLDYKVTNTASSNPGHKHTLANGATDVTASTAQVNVLATGYYDATSSVQTQINTKSPTASPTFTGLVTTPAIKITTGASAGYFLQSDADGDGTWAEASAVTIVQTYTSDDTWTKPAGAKSVLVQMWGAGGGGAGGSTNSGGGGGGGGAYIEQTFNASDLSGTEAIVVGVGAAATAGTNSSFGTTKLIGYGGGAGISQSSGGAGGGGGGIASAGANGSSTTGGSGGSVAGGAGSAGAVGGASLLGGGAGGGASNGGFIGGLSAQGGGGGGGAATNGGAPGVGGAGATSFYGGGGGGAGGGSAGGAGGVSTKAGNGGAGKTGTNNGDAGSIPAGGGGGGAGNASTGGAGARGQVVVTTYF